MRRLSCLLLTLLLCCGACRQKRLVRSSTRPATARLRVDWDTRTGRGVVLQQLRNGDRLRAAFQLRHPGSTGGLVLGSQDESIWDHHQQTEYSYGWSENYGTGKDGLRLAYVSGQVLERGPDRVVLRSENAGGCYRVHKVAYTRLNAPWWIIATRIHNRCQRPLWFDLFSGGASRNGLYQSSDSDLGWTPRALVRHETALGPGQFTAGGFYDLGNQANFIQLDPATPLPEITLFANRLAHAADEIDPRRPLHNKALTALNMGWRQQSLGPGQALTVAFALGLARTGRPGSVPRLPPISLADWSAWRRHMPPRSRHPGGIQFAAELVELDLTRRALTVKGTYYLRSTEQGLTSLGITFPILTGPGRPAPASLLLDGKPVPVKQAAPGRADARFAVSVPAKGLARFVVQYTQRHSGRQAVYMVTSARRWPTAITRAVFRLRHPRSMGPVKLAYEPDHSAVAADGRQVHTVVRQPFAPDREMTLSW